MPPSPMKFVMNIIVVPNAISPKSFGTRSRARTALPPKPIALISAPRLTSTAAPVTARWRTSSLLSDCSAQGVCSALFTPIQREDTVGFPVPGRARIWEKNRRRTQCDF